MTSGAEILQFAGKEGGVDYTANATNPNWVNDASTTGATPKLTLNLVGSEINNTTNNNTQAVIGELVEYEMVLTVPEGTTPEAALVNTLPAGLSLAEFTSVTLSPGLTSSTVTNLGSLLTNTTASGNNFTLNLGTLTNTNTDNATAETITVKFKAVVTNIASNQSGKVLDHKTAKFNWKANNIVQSANAIDADAVSNQVAVVEPDVIITKDVVVNGSGSLGDAGDPFEYTIKISHAANNPDAFELAFKDVLNGKLTGTTIASVTDTAGTLTSSSFEIVGGTLQLKSGIDVDLVGSRDIVIKVKGNLSAAVTPNETIDSDATITWTSLNGDVTNRSAVAAITGDDERTGAGGINDYTKKDGAPIQVENVEPIKSIVSTSETATTNKVLDANGRIIGDDVAIGEIIRYRLVTRLSEGQISNLQIKDNLPAGLKFIDGTAKAGLINTSTNNLSTTDSGLNSAISANIANPDAFVPSFALPDANVSMSDSADNDTYASGTDIFFKFGDITNTGTNSGSEYVVIEFDAVVLDEAGNAAATALANNFDVNIGGVKVNTSSDATTKIVAPQLTITQALTVNGGTAGDAGDLVSITLTVKNTGTADAYEVKLEDLLDATKFDLTNATSVALPAGFSFDKNTPGKIIYSGETIAKGATETFTFTVPLKTAVNSGETLVSKAQITEATTIKGTPSSNIERDIANPDILANDQQLTINKPLLATELVGTQVNNTSNGNTEAVVGELVTYRTTITIPEGTMPSAVLKDLLDPGLAFVGFTKITPSGGVTSSTISNVSDLNTKATIDPNGTGFTLDLGNLVNTNAVNGTPETIVIEYQAVVLNTAANQSTAKESGPQVNNAASLNWGTNPTPATPLSANAANVTIIEPQLQIIKDVAVDGSGDTGNGGDEVVYTITIKHTANSEADAYEVNLTDVLPTQFITGVGAIAITSDSTGSGLTAADFQIAGGNAGSGGTLQLVAGKTLNIPEGKEIVLKVTGKVSDAAVLGQTFDSPAQITWTSLAGTATNLSNHTATGDEERNGTGNLNHYFAEDNAPATIENLSAVSKTLTNTSVGNDASNTVTVGEILTYTVTITVPEGTTPDLKLLDTLDAGLAFVDVVSITPSNGVASSAGAFAPGMGVISNASPADIDKGRVLTVNLGNVTNSNSSENTAETIAITYRAVVLNASLVNDGTTHDNTAAVSWTANGNTSSLTVKAGAVTVSEPKLALELQVLDLSGNPVENIRGNQGDTVTVRVTIASNGSDAFEANAFNLAFSNSLPTGMTFVPGSITPKSGVTPTATNFAGGNITASYDSFADGSTSVFEFKVTLDGAVATGDITNSGQLTYTSIAGNPGTITPNNPFAAERTGDTALAGGTANDLKEINTASVTLNQPPTTIDGSDRVSSGDTVQIPGLGGSDTNAGGSVSKYKIDTLPTVGQLYLGDPNNGGKLVTIGQEIPADQVGNLFYTAPAGFTGTTFTYSSIDNEGFKDSTPATVTLSPNTPPETVNATDRVEPLGTINLEGLNGSDPDGTVANYEITSVPPVGTLYLGNPANGGTGVKAGDTIPPNQLTNLYFQAPAGFTGTSFTYTSIDNDGSKDKTPATVTIESNTPPETVNALQNIPLNAATQITGLTGPLGGSDADGTVAKYKITSLPDAADGELYLGDPNNGGTKITLNQAIPANQIGNLFFKSTGTFNGATFTYASIDNDGTVDATPATVTLNAPPETVDGSHFAAPNTTISLPGMGGSDPDSTVAFYTIKSLPTGGVLYLGSVSPANAIAVGKTLTPAEISQLVFKADPTFSGSTTFTYAATDNYGLADATPATVTIVPPNGNLPPTTVDGSQTVEVGTPAILAGLGGSDIDGTVEKYRIDTLPAAIGGILYLGSANPGNEVKAGQEIPAGQIGNLVFVAKPTFNGGSFTYSAIDNSGTVDATPATYTLNTPPTTVESLGKVNPNDTLQIPGMGGSDLDGTVVNYTINALPSADQGILYLGNPANGGTLVQPSQVIPANQIGNLFFQASGTFTGTTFTYSATDNTGAKDTTPATVSLAPDGVNIAPTTADDQEDVAPGTTVNLPDLTGSDPDGTVDKYRIDNLPDPADGILYLGNTPVTSGDEIPADQLGNLTFVATPQFNGGSFTYSAIDNNGEVDPTPATVTLNAPPETPDGSQLVTPNTNVPLTVPTGSDSDGTVDKYRINTLPDATDGVLYIGNPNLGNVVTAGQLLNPTQLSQLVFKATPGFDGGSFTYSAIDNTGTADPTPATFVLATPPTTVDSLGKVNPGDTLQVPGLGGSDIDGTVASYTINPLPPADQGTLYLGDPASGGTAVNPGDVIPADQIGNLYFQASGTFTGTTFTYSATDNDGNIDATPATVNLTPTGVNLAPTTTDDEETVAPGTTVNLPDLGGSDPDGTVAKYRIDTLPDPEDGILYLGNTPVTPGDEIPADQLGNLKFTATPEFEGGSFTYSAIDNLGEVDPTPATVTLSPSNTPPDTLSGSQAVNPNTAATLTGLVGSDPDGTVDNYRIETLPPAAQGTLYLGNEAIAPGQILTPAELSQLVFQATGNFTGTSFKYTAIDNTGIADPSPAIYILTPGNIPPDTDNASGLVNPNESVNLTGLGGSDTDGTIAYYTIQSLPPAGQGTLYLGDPASNITVNVGDILTPSQLQQLYFQAAAGFTGTSFTYAAADDDGAIDPTPAKVTLTPGNLPPETKDLTQDVAENTTIPLTGLGGNDPDGSVQFYTIETLPSEGTLYLGDPTNGGKAVTVGQTLTPFELSQLYFQAPAGYTGSNFNYSATDNQGLKDLTPATVFLPLPGGNLPPNTDEATGQVVPGDTLQIPGLGGSDPNADAIDFYQITTLPDPADGVLYLGDPANGGIKVNLNDQIPADRIGDLFFQATDNFDGTTFTYAAIDPKGAIDPTPATVTLKPLDNNQPPETVDSSTAVNPGGSLPLTGFDGSDPDGTVALYQIETVPSGDQGTLYLYDPLQGKTPVTAGQVLTPNQLQFLIFEASPSFTGTAFTYTAIDNKGAKDPTPATFSIGSNYVPPVVTPPAVIPPVVTPPDTPTNEELLIPQTNLEPDPQPDPQPDPTPPKSCQECCPTPPTIEGLSIAPIDPLAGTDVAPPNEPDSNPLSDQLNGSEKSDTLSGGDGDDIAYGGQDGDLLSGDLGNDTLGGDRGDDTILGSLGRGTEVGDTEERDQLYGNDGRDLLKGGEGKDTIYGGQDEDLVYGGKDDDVVLGELGDDTLTGDRGNDTLRGGTEQSANADVSGRDLVYGAEGNDYLYGNESNDTLSGGDGDDLAHGGKDGDLIFGDLGNDSLYGELGDDTILGSLGRPTAAGDAEERDLLSGNDGNDIIKGGEGGDSIFAGKDDDLVYAGKDDDLVYGDWGSDTLVGDQGNDTISGGNGNPNAPEGLNANDVIFGGDGTDVMDGNFGNDSLVSGSGDDVALGGKGDDILWGEAGKDMLMGDLGNDTLCGGDDDDLLVGSNGDPGNTNDGNDLLCGGNGNDRLFGNEGNDTLNGGGDDDCLFAGKGDDLLIGCDGNDQLFGEEGRDTLMGGSGNDVFVLRQDTGTDLISDFVVGQDLIGLVDLTYDDLTLADGSTGLEIWTGNTLLAIVLGVSAADLTPYDFTTDLRCEMNSKAEECGCPTVPTIEGLPIVPIAANDGDDVAYGSLEGDLMSGALGNDSLMGDLGDDTILGSLGNVQSVGRSGERDLLSGNDGNDIIKGGEGEDSIYAGQDNDLVYAGKDNDLVFGDWGSDTLVGDLGDDTLSGGNGRFDTPEFANSNDLMFGGDGQDVMDGNEGNDSLSAGTGDDQVRGGRGDDILWGEAGNDLLLGDFGNDTICAGDGDDTLVGGNGNPSNTGDGSDKLCGGAGNDAINGNEGDDRLCGDAGNDTLLGGKQNDILMGGAGNDFLAGEQGSDRLIGGEGSDAFAIASGSGVETIADFQVGVDQIVLSGGLTWEQLSLQQVDKDTVLNLGGDRIAVLEGVRIASLSNLN